MGEPNWSRRALLSVAAAGCAVSLSGCANVLGTERSNERDSNRTYGSLSETPLYVNGDVDLAIPDEATAVDGVEQAELVLLPSQTTVESATVADWLVAGKIVGLLGESAQTTWNQWLSTSPFQRAFDQGAYIEDPPPQMLIGAVVSQQPINPQQFKRVWPDDPTDPEILRSLDVTVCRINAMRNGTEDPSLASQACRDGS